ncbi:3-deoxy-manno-octulosonate cytidylyltransferase [Porticoccus sp. W117]|uniref:3-deoxy-manno-octulosonate cytidylyltransferase n=1 Tax=Porticoccus sp. W117 TaxID=3054777 RepID=UPI0025926E28|nr:3-deoxy-manno-octulosonate cytidylyltransferase [Porticoccus sp. W117]MDM3872128.1 3-deoxy-manno-octulosonate cytidylyltransferase [Porticoccus sp. W117]
MSFLVVIPARYSSTRLPGKPLRDIAGHTMIERVYRQAQASDAERVIVATDDQRIADVVTGFGGEVCMTSADHPSGTDRLQEVAGKLQLAPEQIVVNVQGDEPLIPPSVINQVAANLAGNSEAGVSTLCEPIETTADFANPNIVKVVGNHTGMALYFSRAPIPWPRDHAIEQGGLRDALPEQLKPMRHIGIYGYRVEQLNRFVTWPAAPLETIECLEQLRFMWQGVGIHVAEACAAVPGGVDTPEDLQRVIDELERQQ